MPTAIKQSVLEMIERMPEDVTVADIMAERYFREQIDAGLQELDAGEGIEHEAAKQKLAKWLLPISPIDAR